MPREKYFIKELSPTRILVENNQWWNVIKREEIAGIIEDLVSKGRKVVSTIPFNSRKNGKDYLIILQ